MFEKYFNDNNLTTIEKLTLHISFCFYRKKKKNNFSQIEIKFCHTFVIFVYNTYKIIQQINSF